MVVPIRHSEFLKRIITSLVGITTILSVICWNPWGYFGLFLFIMVCTMAEFYKLTSLQGISPSKRLGVLAGSIIYTGVFMCIQRKMPIQYLFILVPIFALICISQLHRGHINAPFTNIAYTVLGVVYIAVPFSLIHMLAYPGGEYHPRMIISFLLILWGQDVGAYLVGKSLGKRLFWQRLSPKKTWEGSIGGAVAALLISYGISYYNPLLCKVKWITLGMVVVVMGTYGDLIESWFKRSINIKDSGRALPGHGGFLDRFDSFLLAVPSVAALLALYL